MNDELWEESGRDSITVKLIRHILDMPLERQEALLKQIEEIPVISTEISDRDDSRKIYKNSIEFSVLGETYRGISQDLSPGGIFIKTDDTFTVGQMIHVTIPFSNNQKRARIPGEIVRVIDDGIGVKFMKKIA